MNRLIDLAVDHKRLVLAILAMLLVVGAYSYGSIPKEENPDVQFPLYSIVMAHDGISPEDAERMLIRPMERHLQTIEGLKEMTARGLEGSAQFVLEFEPDADPDTALADIREAVDMGKADLPDETEEPVVDEYSISQSPILTIVLFGSAPERALVAVAENLKDSLEGIPQVLEARVNGKREEVLEVIVDPAKLETYNIGLGELLTVVQNNNRLVAAGALNSGDGRFAIKVPGLFETAEDVAGIPVRTSRDGVVTLGDLGEARRGFKDATSYARFNGRPSITVEVVKRVGTNTMKAADAAKALTRRVATAWPESLQYEFINDSSVFVAEFIGTLENSVLSAVALVAILVVATLGARSAILVGVSIPGAFLFGILMLSVLGYTINNVVLFGLILAVGLLVDGAIVVSEYADRKMLDGADRDAAFKLAAKRMAWPIIASTATTLAAFVPLLFWPDVMGDFMGYLPVTVIFTLIGSLLMALIFLPTLGSLIGKPGEADASTMEHIAGDRHFEPRALTGATGWYVRMLDHAIRRPWLIAAATLAILLGVWTLFIIDNEGQILFPDGEPNSAQLLVHARGNLSINEMDRLVRDVESRLSGVPGIENQYTIVGAGAGDGQDTVGRVTMIFDDWHSRPPVQEIEGIIRDRVRDVPGVRLEFAEQEQGPVRGKAIEIEVASESPSLLNPAVTRLRDHMDGMAGLVDIEDSRPVAGIEWRMEVDRAEAGRFGTDISTVGSFIQLVTNGALVGTYRPAGADDEVDIRVRYPKESRGLMALDHLRVPTDFGMVPISNFLRRVAKPQTGEIERIDGKRVLTLAADVANGAQPFAKVKDIRDWIVTQDFDPRLNISFAGEDEMQRDATSFLSNAFLIALFMMATILLAQFNSFFKSALILTAVLLSTVGVVFGLWLLDRPFVVIMTGVGIIALAGIVVNNNIVLIDTYNRMRRQGIAPHEAILRTGAQRLRPVLLTTITTIIGLIPMAMQFNVDFLHRTVEIGSPTSFIWVDLAMSIIFGLAFATVLTLVVTPSMLALEVRIKTRLGRLRARLGRRGADASGTTHKPETSLPKAAE